MKTLSEFLLEREIKAHKREYNTDPELIKTMVHIAWLKNVKEFEDYVETNNLNPLTKNSWGKNALMASIESNNIDIIKYILSIVPHDEVKLEAHDIKTYDEDTFNLVKGFLSEEELYYFLSNAMFDTNPEQLILNNLSLIHNKQWIQNLFYSSIKHSYFKVAKALLKKGADINATNTASWSPLYTSILDNNLKGVKFLLANKVDINILKKGVTLEDALSVTSTEIKKLFA